MRGVAKVKFSSLLFLIGACWLLVSFGLIVTNPHASHAYSVRQTMVNEATLLQNYTASYPIFHDHMLDSMINSFIQEQLDTFEKTVANRSDFHNRMDISYQLTRFGKRGVDVAFLVKVRKIGRPDVLTKHHLLIDLTLKKQLKVKDIFIPTEEARLRFASLLHDYFKLQPQAQLTPSELVGLLEVTFDNVQAVEAEPSGLVFRLNPHQPADVLTTVQVAVNDKLLHGIVSDDFLSVAPVPQSRVPVKVDYRIAEQPAPGDTIDPAGKMLALTFDDGPSGLTNNLLDQLHKYQSHATFFVLGYAVGGHVGELRHTIQTGNEIGNHSWSHADLRTVSPEELDHQVVATQQAVQAATGGYAPRLMRPPYGATNPRVHDYLAARGFTQALWNVDTRDWLDKNAELVYQRVMASAHDGAVILLHDIHPTSVEAALRAIRDLKAQGYQLVTLSQLYQYR